MLVGEAARRRADRPRRRAAARADRARCRPGRACSRRQSRRSTSSEQRRRRFFGLAGSQAPQPSAGRGTPPDEPQPRMVNVNVMRGRCRRPRHFGEQAERNSPCVCRAISSRMTPRTSRQHLGGLDHVGRLVALAAIGPGRQIRRVGLDQNAVGRQFGGDGAQRIGFLEGQDAGERDVEPERDARAAPGRGRR